MKKQRLKLVFPSKKYLKSWQGFCEEFIRSLEDKADRESYEKQLVSSKKEKYFIWHKWDRLGIHLEKGRVPQTIWWGVVGSQVVGRISFRHKLHKQLKIIGGHIGYAVRPSARGKGYATQMLAMVLKRIKNLGHKKVMLTCDKDNTASRKTIEANGGKLEKTFKYEGVLECCYWIILK